MSKERIKELEKKIEDLKRRWPIHSVKPWMLQELEDELEEEKKLEDAEGGGKERGEGL